MGKDGLSIGDVVFGALVTPSNGKQKEADKNIDDKLKEESDGKNKE